MVRDGYFYGGALLAVAVVIYGLTGSWIWPAIPVLLAVFFLWFFRDPRRVIPQGEGLIVSPADGVVTSTDLIQTPSGQTLRLSIFLNVFDVHVNRSPVAGVLRDVRYQKGKYLNAMNPDSADQNEQNSVVVEGYLESSVGGPASSYQVTFKQIAGLLARRIVFNKRPGDRVERGERVGLIKFGSRVDVLLPANAALRVEKGQRVKGGSTVLAALGAHSQALAGDVAHGETGSSQPAATPGARI